MPYLLRSWSVPVELEELVVAELWSAGVLGCQTVDGGEGELAAGTAPPPGRVRVVAWFAIGEAGEAGSASRDPLRDWFAAGVEPLGAEETPDEDWLAAWRERARPFALGRRFWVDPREPDEETPLVPPAGRRLLRLPARSAFGIGSHESTRLAVQLIEDAAVVDRDVLDVGTGTGILAFAALHLGARLAVACDVDPVAAVAARDNAIRNDLAPRLFAGDVSSLAPDARFDWALVNIVPELILPALPSIAGRVDGMVLSGILAEKGEAVLGTVIDLGFNERARAADGEWVAFRVERPEADRLAIPPIPATFDLPEGRTVLPLAPRSGAGPRSR